MTVQAVVPLTHLSRILLHTQLKRFFKIIEKRFGSIKIISYIRRIIQVKP